MQSLFHPVSYADQLLPRVALVVILRHALKPVKRFVVNNFHTNEN